MIENLGSAEPYSHQQGIFPAREAIVMQQQDRGVLDVIRRPSVHGERRQRAHRPMSLRALLNAGDEVLVPSPDYPLWTAATVLNGGTVRHYPCSPENGFAPDLDAVADAISEKTRALVVINPNNPTGAVYSEALPALGLIALGGATRT